MRETSKDLLAADLTKEFVEAIIRNVGLTYKQVGLSLMDSAYGEKERQWLAPYLRRAEIETRLRREALDAGLMASSEETETGSAFYTLIQTARLNITVSKTDSPGVLPEKCDFRQQRSDVNGLMSQAQMFPVPPANTINDADRYYAIIIHGPNRKDRSEVGFLSIGFPDDEFKEWVEPPVALVEILDRIVARSAEAEDLRKEIQVVDPMLKAKFRSDKERKEEKE